MRKKVLVLTLALVLAFASSAMAAVDFGGKVTFTAEQKSFKLFADDYTLTPGLQFSISAENENKTEETLNWDFTGSIGLKTTTEFVMSEPEDEDDEDFEPEIIDVKSTTAFTLGAYKLGLYDNYFDIYVWGNGQKLSTEATAFGMISAGEQASTHRARLVVPIDVATVTLDFEPKNNLRAFVNAEVSDFEVGFAYARKGWDEDGATNVLVGQVATSVPTGDLEIGLNAAVGATLGDDIGFAFGVGADIDLTNELNLSASVKNANEYWDGDAVTPKNTVIGLEASYTDDNIAASADLTHTMDKDDDNTTDLELDAVYRMGTLAYNQLFNRNHWFKTDAPAFGANLDFSGLKFGGITLNATAPVVDDMVWVWANAQYVDEDTITAKLTGHVLATDKLTLKPSVEYKKAGKIFDLVLKANYKIGYSDTTLDLQVQKKFADEDENKAELLQASITIPF